jgi:hypothetical protein
VANITGQREVQDRKQPAKRSSTEFGMEIDDIDEHNANASDSIRQSFEAVGKVTSRREAQH